MGLQRGRGPKRTMTTPFLEGVVDGLSLVLCNVVEHVQQFLVLFIEVLVQLARSYFIVPALEW